MTIYILCLCKKYIVLNIYYCKHCIYTLLRLFSFIGQKVNVSGDNLVETRDAGTLDGLLPCLT